MAQAAGLYIHIPFCKTKCHYCDFYSFAPQPGFCERYIAALKNQLSSFAPTQFDSVYLGGGTPSLLEPAQVADLLEAAKRHHTLLAGTEITLELNPGDADLEKLRGYRAAGVNRLSVGVQSLCDAALRATGRRHSAAQALETLRLAANVFGNVSADLLIGLPGQTRASLLGSIDGVASAGVSHVSAYMLKLMQNTPFGDDPPRDLPPDDETAESYLLAIERLAEHGLVQYEISNFAKPGLHSRHNCKYWELAPYLGLGPAAASLLGDRRYKTPPDAERFAALYEQGPLCDPLAHMDDEGPATAADYIMLRLRTTDGLDLDKLYNLYDFEFDEQRVDFIKQCVTRSLAARNGNTLSLTPRGMLVSNSILSRLI